MSVNVASPGCLIYSTIKVAIKKILSRFEKGFFYYMNKIAINTAASTRRYMANGTNLMREINFKKNLIAINAKMKALIKPTT